ncbi:Crp/Fnr family transcriptional regulator [Roseateles albus]|uniref:Crp/Fnr family transcriptional regulator n=1 Tax=Roseateles albus TaxID=2987525 RepID=A0ABT5KKQ1_9BURK|nr:Crp/Fnr family transcriptional regulator [Roseateles albus]MDC8773401.1 Crp/Fnr family transcriptional regulator [Roseateles albus]
MTQADNHLLELLPMPSKERLLALCEPVQLRLSDRLSEPDQPCSHVYFPVDAFVSLLALTDGHPGLEVGMVGREGMVGAHLVLGVDHAPVRALVQGTGLAWRLATDSFQAELALSPSLHSLLQRFVYVLMAQTARCASCLRFHLILPRLARCLLMSHDRAHADDFYVTHEFLADMLGVRRVGVTQAAGKLQSQGLIAYHRGHVSVLHRAGLEAAACSCYGLDNALYAKHLS